MRDIFFYGMIVLLLHVSMYPFIYWLAKVGGMNWKIDLILFIWLLITICAIILPKKNPELTMRRREY